MKYHCKNSGGVYFEKCKDCQRANESPSPKPGEMVIQCDACEWKEVVEKVKAFSVFSRSIVEHSCEKSKKAKELSQVERLAAIFRDSNNTFIECSEDPRIYKLTKLSAEKLASEALAWMKMEEGK